MHPSDIGRKRVIPPPTAAGLKTGR